MPLVAFPFQIGSVPLANTLLDGQVTYNYTLSATYGSNMDHCSLYLRNGLTQILSAEQNAVGQATSCIPHQEGRQGPPVSP